MHVPASCWSWYASKKREKKLNKKPNNLPLFATIVLSFIIKTRNNISTENCTKCSS